MKILFWLVYINAAQNGIQDITPYLKELKERELNNEMPYSVDEVFEIFENELGIDLEEILKEHSITRDDIENFRLGEAVDELHYGGPEETGGFGGGTGLTADYDDDEAVIFRGFSQKKPSFSSLSSTSNSIMNMIFNLGGMSNGIPTPPPMPVLTTTKAEALWAPWNAWSNCPVSCGGGSRKRYRSCKRTSASQSCSGSHRQVGFCNTQPCAQSSQWLQWGVWGSCTRSCGVGQQIRRRKCSGTACTGDSVHVQRCSNGACAGGTPQWNSWSSWSNCSKSCSGGYRGRLRSCSAGKGCPGKSREIQICNKGVPCRKNMNLVWGAWSSCSATCGEGNKTRTRECSFSPAKCRRFRLTDSETCLNSEPCGAWANWEAWGKCTVSCGLGVKARTRKCVGGTAGTGGCVGDYEDISACNSQTCPSWTNWQPWSSCTATCGGGVQRRARYCTNGTLGNSCPGDASEERTCQTDACPRWSDWAEWSDCNAECGGGTRTTNRKCINGNQGQRGCFGQETFTQNCNLAPCAAWSEWSKFSGCTKTCGGGMMAQSRECVGGEIGVECKGTHENIQMCNEEECPKWRNWSEWGSCSVTCGKGVRNRSRSCSGSPSQCSGDDKEVQFCGSNECPAWTAWSDYSSCSKSCGGGLKQRSRACNAGFGKCGSESPYERVACNDIACDELSEWSEWTECTKQCGGGNTSRSRKCTTGTCAGMGSTLQTGQCNTEECEWNDWSVWSECVAVACGEPGSSSRTRDCNGDICNGSASEKKECVIECSNSEASRSEVTMDEFVKEIDSAKATASPEVNDSEECFTLNVNGECLDHLNYTKDDKIVEVGSCNLPAFIIQNDKIMGSAELITSTRVRYKCMESFKLRGPKNIECKCRNNNCRQTPKKTPRCIKSKDGKKKKRMSRRKRIKMTPSALAQLAATGSTQQVSSLN